MLRKIMKNQLKKQKIINLFENKMVVDNLCTVKTSFMNGLLVYFSFSFQHMLAFKKID